MTEKQTIFIRFTDDYCQYTHKQKESMTLERYPELPLYCACERNTIKQFQDAKVSEDSIPLMIPKEKLEAFLEESRKRVLYKVPTAQQLWCEMMKRICDKAINQAHIHEVDANEIVISLPEYLDGSLREMILTAAECSGKMLGIEMKVTSNSMMAAHFFPLYSYLATASNTPNKFPGVQINCFIESFFNETQWSIVLSKDTNAVVLKTGKVDIGNYSFFRECFKKLLVEQKEIGEFHSLTRQEKHCLIEMIKHPWIYLVNIPDCTKTHFDNIEGDKVFITREEYTKEVEVYTKEIVEKIMETVNEVNGYLATVDKIQLGNEIIELDEDHRKVKEFVVDSLNKNGLLFENLKEQSGMEFIYTNGFDQNVIRVGSAVKQTVIYKMIEPNKFEVATVEFGNHEGKYDVKDITEVINNTESVQKNYKRLLVVKSKIQKETHELKDFKDHKKEIFDAIKEIGNKTIDADEFQKLWDAYKEEYAKKYGQ